MTKGPNQNNWRGGKVSEILIHRVNNWRLYSLGLEVRQDVMVEEVVAGRAPGRFRKQRERVHSPDRKHGTPQGPPLQPPPTCHQFPLG